MNRGGHGARSLRPDGMSEIELTEREPLVARKAAKLAVEEMTNEICRQVGKSVLTRIFVWVGAVAVGIAVAKGWITWKP